MRYKKLQRANVEVSEIGVGTWAMGGQHFGPANRQESIKAIHKMVDMGVNLIDTAPVYGNGRAEMIVGDVLKEIPRDKVLISTKFGIVPNYFSEGRTRKDASSANIVREIESSLMNLGTDYVDFYFVHWPAVNTPIAETMTALETLRQKEPSDLSGCLILAKRRLRKQRNMERLMSSSLPIRWSTGRLKDLSNGDMTKESIHLPMVLSEQESSPALFEQCRIMVRMMQEIISMIISGNRSSLK